MRRLTPRYKAYICTQCNIAGSQQRTYYPSNHQLHFSVLPVTSESYQNSLPTSQGVVEFDANNGKNEHH